MVTHDRLAYWLKGERLQNFGDYLGEFLAETLFLVFDEASFLRLSGSVIDDGMIPPNLANDDQFDLSQPRVSFWGCGIRTRGGLLHATKAHIDLFAVRGPVSASDLRLGQEIPIGDPALLLPALYSPKPHPLFQGKSLCIPHFHDQRDDEELLSFAKGDTIIRTAIPNNKAALLRFIDAVASASFVLSASLHGAIVAAAYGRPFAFWDNGHVDLPTKWEDFAASARLEMHGCKTIAEARGYYKTKIKPKLRLPSLWPLLASAPCQLNPLGLLKVLRYELTREGSVEASRALDPKIETFCANANHFELLAERTRTYSHKRLKAESEKLAAQSSELTVVTAEAERRAQQARLQAEELQERIAIQVERIAELSRVIEASDAKALESDQKEQQFSKRLAEVNECLNEERHNFTLREQALEARLTELSQHLELAREKHMAAEANVRAATAELASNAPALVAAERLVRRYLALESPQPGAGGPWVDLADQISALDRKLEREHERYKAALCSAEMALTKNVEVNSLMEQAVAEAQRARDDVSRAQAAHAEMRSALSESRSEIEKIRASLSRSEHDLFLERLAKRAADARILRLEREAVVRAQTSISAHNLFDRLSGRRAERRALADQVRQIADYTALFDASRTMAPDPTERNVRIVQFLLSASDSLPDLPFFDVPTYLRMYSDSVPPGVNPLIHYLSCPAEAKQRPHVLFDTGYYQKHYPSSVTENLDSLAHYVKWGADKGYNPHPVFDTQYYFSRHPDVAANRVNPLAHYLRYPGCSPHPLFDTGYYVQQGPTLSCPGQTPLEHYLTEGALAGLNPHPWFASRFYLDRYPDVAAAGVNPLVHYLTYGALEGRDPHPEFSTQAYFDAHPGLRESGVNPLVHRVTNDIGLRADSSPPPSAVHEDAIHAKVTTDVESPTGSRRRIALMVDAYYPRPDNDSGSLDQVAFVGVFQALGYEVHFAADLELGAETPYREQLTAMGVKCVTYPNYLSINDYLARNADEIAIGFLSRVHFGSRHTETIRQLCPQAVVIFNTVDLHHVREQREAELKGSAEGFARAKETYCAEAAATRDADATIVVSQREAEYWKREVPEGNVFMVPLLRDYRVARDNDFEARSGIAFIGGFRHMPNVDAVEHFLDDVWPLVHARMPDVEFQVIGANLPDTLSVRADPGVRFVGYVEDLKGQLAGLRLTVAPLRYGAGAKGKVVTSLAHGVPCVVSSIASEGMGLTDGVHVAVADTSEDFAEKIVSLYHNRDAWTAQSNSGMDLIRERHSLDHGIALMRKIIRSAEDSTADKQKAA
jgi:hypothetical protein